VEGIAIKTYQYLRMLFGVNTIAPNRHIMRLINDALGKKINGKDAIILMEEAAKRMGWEARNLDNAIWKKQSES
jgi:hypothetical protein